MTAPDNAALQTFYGTLPLFGAILLAMWNNNTRLNELSKRMDDMKDSITGEMRSGFADVKERLGRLEDRVTDLEKGSRLIRG